MQENKNNVEFQQEVTNIPKNNSSNKILWAIIGFLVMGVFILLGIIIVGGGYWYLHQQKTKIQNTKDRITQDFSNQKQNEETLKNNTNVTSQKQTKKEQLNLDKEKKLVYENKEFGFRVNIPESWAKYDYKVKQIDLGGDFNVADVDFYLPSQEYDEGSDIPGYVDMFSISVYVTESWNENEDNYNNDDTYGEVIGTNDFYTFVYSHIDIDEQISDIFPQALKDMDTIAHSIEFFGSQSVVHDDNILSNTDTDIDYDSLYSDKFAFDDDYAKHSIEYWNCEFDYQLNYPSSWSNNGITNISKNVVLYGNNVTTTIRAVDAEGLTTEEFFVREYKREFPKAVLEPEGDKFFMAETNTMTYYLAFAAPYEWRLYWRVIGSNTGIIMTVKGSGFIKEWDNITKMFGTLRVNITQRPECAS